MPESYLNPRRHNSEIELNSHLLRSSNLFDPTWYIERVGEEAAQDPIEHYLTTGWRYGAEPNERFAGALLGPYFALLAPDLPPAVTWILLDRAGWRVPQNRAQLDDLAHRILRSGLFDEAYYNTQLASTPPDVEPILHYLTVGEYLGMSPCQEFSPWYYQARYPEVLQNRACRLLHYIESGRAHGFRTGPVTAGHPGLGNFQPERENVLLVVHDGSRSGAPILGWNIAKHLALSYNLFTICLGDGPLLAHFRELSAELFGPFPADRRDEIEIEYSLRPLLERRRYHYAIVNSVASHVLVSPCLRRFIPTVLLVHEFLSYMGASYSLRLAVDSATELVFPASVVRDAAEEANPNLRNRRVNVLPQGLAELPPSEEQSTVTTVEPPVITLVRGLRDAGTVIVVGMGPVEYRKGVDLFLSTAASIVRRGGGSRFHFLWVGGRYRPAEDLNYCAFLKEQIDRSGLRESVTFVDAVSDLNHIYEAADLFLLSSRLDPLPNVVIDAAHRGIPVICFAKASGIAELMSSNPDTALAVVDHLSAEEAAGVIVRLGEDVQGRRRLGSHIRELAKHHFDMKSYVAALDEMGRRATALMRQRQTDANTLVTEPEFDQDMFLGPRNVIESRWSTIVRYLTIGAECGWQTQPSLSYRRRPCAGFNPRVYFAAHSEELADGADPLADYLRRGRPDGAWRVSVLLPLDTAGDGVHKATLRVALHAHCYYPELVPDLLRRVEANKTSADLLLTTDQSWKANQLEYACRDYAGGRIKIQVLPNRGRDIGPLLTVHENLDTYDLVGHVHTKRSPYPVDSVSVLDWGDSWREFLWQNVLGDLYPMMDRIVAAFETQEDLGLVFPSDPNVCGWDENRDIASRIAGRMGWRTSLPDYFDFPVGTMFWVRRPALQPLLDLGLKWSDYPDEPVQRDGTLLHALERLIPFACVQAGFRYAVTQVPGVSWMPPT